MYKKKYKEKYVIGRGNFGVATLVCERASQLDYISKKIALSSLSDYELKCCQLEAKLLESLNHPNIVRYHETFLEEDQLMIIMEYCPGGDLSQLIKTHKESRSYFPEDQIALWMTQLISALHFLEERRVIHRDIKSSNVYITEDGNLKLGDFGIAKILSCTSDVAKTVVGTPYYMSPEVCENKPYTCKSDIWSLGCLIYELACLRHPFDGTSFLALVMSILKEDPTELPSCYSNELKHLVLSMLAKDPKNRPNPQELLKLDFFAGIVVDEDVHDYDSSDNSQDDIILYSGTDQLGISLVNPMDLINTDAEFLNEFTQLSQSDIPTFTPDVDVIKSNIFITSKCFEANHENESKTVKDENDYEDDFESVIII